MRFAEDELLRQSTAMQVACHALLTIDSGDHQGIKREIDALEKIHKEMAKTIKKIKKENA